MLVVAPTVQAEGSLAGEKLAALALELPAATARKWPAEVMARAALLTAVLVLPPSDMLTTTPLGHERVRASVTTKFMPLMTPELVPEPEALSTLTPRSVVRLATPYLVPPMVPATCVPWPLPSVLELSTKLATWEARPPKSCRNKKLCVSKYGLCSHFNACRVVRGNPIPSHGGPTLWAAYRPVSIMYEQVPTPALSS